MLTLKDLDFTDLLVLPDGAYLKGMPRQGHRLLSVAQELPAFDAQAFAAQCSNAQCKKLIRLPENEKYDLSVRVTFDEVSFRATPIMTAADGDGELTWIARRLPATVPTLKELKFPPNYTDWLLRPEHTKGLILFLGDQASGKTWSASALLAERLALWGGHAITFEDPPELPLNGRWGKYGHCFQTEFCGDFETKVKSVKNLGSPNILFVGQIRDKNAAYNTLKLALGAGETLVIATLHGLDIHSGLENFIADAAQIGGTDWSYNTLANVILAVFHQEISRNIDEDIQMNLRKALLVPFGTNSAGEQVGEKIRSAIRTKNMKLNELINIQMTKIKNSPKGVIGF